MDERTKFVAAYLREEECMAELCRRFGISRKTGYKWLYRYHREGPVGLQDRLSRPIHSPRRTPAEVEELLVKVRQAHPSWGPKKIRAYLLRSTRRSEVPAASTIGEVLKRHGLVLPRKRRRRAVPSTSPFASYRRPNAVWCVDFKGDFRVGARRCYPLTVIDGYSRYLISCRALSSTGVSAVRKALYDAFHQYGLPDVIRTDNGPPFASTGAGGLSQLGAWLIRLDVLPERIEPGKPQQNGRQERFHKTLKQQTASPPKSSLRKQQRCFDSFQVEYNFDRPHESLGQVPPAEVYERSDRDYPEVRVEPEYTPDFECFRTRKDGAMDWRGWRVQLNACLDREVVGVRPLGDRRYEVYFGSVRLGDFQLPLSRRGRIKLTNRS